MAGIMALAKAKQKPVARPEDEEAEFGQAKPNSATAKPNSVSDDAIAAPAGEQPPTGAPPPRGGNEAGGGFQKPDVSQFVPPEVKDAVDRIVAAGLRIITAPEMRQEVMAELNRDVPLPQKLAEGTVGLLLTLDGKVDGGIPMPAMFPAAIALLGETAELVAQVEPVTREDFNTAAATVFVLMGRKMGGSDEEIMASAEQMAGQAEGQPQGAPA